MPTVSVAVTVQVEIPDDVGTLEPIELERAIRAEGQRAARELFQGALEVLDEAACRGHGAKQRREPRWIATTFGRMRISRYRVHTDQGSIHPLDRLMAIGQAEATIGLREAICDLALRLPCRQVAEAIGAHTGQVLSHQGAWRILRAEGARVRNEEGRLVEAIFVDGEAPPEPVDVAELVVLEADGTFLRAQREDSDRFEVRSAIAYTGKAPAGGRRHRRWRLHDKLCHASCADADRFGQGLAAAGFTRFGLHRVPHVLCAHDGADDYGATFADWFPGAHHQIDHFHLAKRIWEVCGNDEVLFRRLRKRALRDPTALARSLRKGAFVEVDKGAELAGYLEHVGPDLWGIRRLPPHLRQGRMFIVGSGGIEKHQDLLVGRRMKGRGMRWTKAGADHLLALQARRFSGCWEELWEVQAA